MKAGCSSKAFFCRAYTEELDRTKNLLSDEAQWGSVNI